MINLTLEQTEELEKAIKIKKQASDLYSDFVKYFTLEVRSFKDGAFEVWSDSHNRAFVQVKGDRFSFHCRFFHESYDVLITPSSLFDQIKSGYRGIVHFEDAVGAAKRKKLAEIEKKQ